MNGADRTVGGEAGATDGPSQPTLWIDVGDLFHYLAHHNRPSGIQRVTYEICSALYRRDDGAGAVRFLRRDGGPRDLVTVDWQRLNALYRRIADPAPTIPPMSAAPDLIAPDREIPDREIPDREALDMEAPDNEAPDTHAPQTAFADVDASETFLEEPVSNPPVSRPMVPAAFPPLRARQVVRSMVLLQGGALLAAIKLPFLAAIYVANGVWRKLTRIARIAAVRRVRRSTRAAPPPAPVPEPVSHVPEPAASIAEEVGTGADEAFETAEGLALSQEAKPGDSLIVLGSPWYHGDYVQTVRWIRDDLRMRFALLMHDLIPLRRPEWCDRGVITSFAEWHISVLPFADQIFANSRATAADVSRWLRETGVAGSATVRAVPMGTGLIQGSGAAMADPSSTAHLPTPGSYALFVSTVEARKNHALLFRVWRQLLAELPREQVPTLVFAGRVGWLVSDLMQQLENAGWLNGKIRLVRDPTDAELMALYRGCQFTLFPSLFEGWGLPISESLALGRPCVASNRTSLPEAGGDLARYFDPENLDDACRAIREVIEDPAGLEAWRDRVARDFQRVPWEHTADAIRGTLNGLGRG